MFGRLFIVIAVTFSVPWAAAELQLKMSTQCQEWLAPRWDSTIELLKKVLHGDGDVVMYTPAEFNTVMGLPTPTTFHHRSAYALLPPTAQHMFGTVATTYIDRLTRYLAFSADHRWLAFNVAQLPTEQPQHVVVMSHPHDWWVGVHESVHLEDYDAVYEYARSLENGKILMLRLDVFKIVTELNAYRRQYQAMISRNPEASKLLGWLTANLEGEIGQNLRELPVREWLPIARALNLTSPDTQGFEKFLASKDGSAIWPDLLRTLPSSILREEPQ